MATLLYVDDEDALRRAFRSLLTRRGYTVLTASSSDEARAILTSRSSADRIDAVLIDIWLAGESGFDLFEWIDMNYPDVAGRAAFVTGAIVRDPEVDHALAALERPVLTKPFELGELERLVERWNG